MESDQIARYSRQIILPSIGLEGQERLAKSKVLVIGMGGLGSPAALYLTAAGIGTIGLAEFDLVEAHNLQRQILHDDARIGSPKLGSAIARLKALNPKVQLIPHSEGITLENAIPLFSDYDIIVDGTDNFPTRYLNNDAAFFAQKPLIYGSVFQFEGQVSVFDPHREAPCYRCLFPQMPEPGSVPNCDQAGVFGALCGVIGSYQAMEVIKYLTGAGTGLQGRLLVIDALEQLSRTLNLKKDPQCPLCGCDPTITHLDAANYAWTCETPTSTEQDMTTESNERPLEITTLIAAEWLKSDQPPFLLDVRESHELAICQIAGNHHIPMQEVPDRLDALPRDQAILVQCHHGGRSLKVTQFLRSKGFQQAHNLSGGIHQWALQIDPSLQRY